MNPVERLVFDPTEPATVADPFGAYDWLRAHEPVYRLDDGTYVVTRDEDVRVVLHDTARFAALEPVAPGRISPLILATTNPPEHTRLRRAVSGHFRKRTVDGLRPVIERTTDTAIASLRAHGRGDVVEVLAIPVPMYVIAGLLGVPDDRFDDLQRWSDALMDLIAISGFGMDPSRAPDAPRVVRGLTDYMRALVSERAGEGPRAHEATDLIDHLLHHSEEELTEVEVVSLAIFLLVAGHETTANMLAAAIHHLVAEPEVAERCSTEPDAIAALVEEVVRTQSPIQRTVRVAREDVELSGLTVPKGSRLLAYIGAANRDPGRYARPDEIQLDGAPSDHLGFGLGIHYCVGAPLARLEGEIVVRRWLEELPDATLDPDRPVRWRRRPEPRGIESLPVVVPQ